MQTAAQTAPRRRAASASLPQRLLLLVLGLVCLASLFGSASATLPPSKVELVHKNSTALSFVVSLPSGSDADKLHVHQQPERDGNATDAYFVIQDDAATDGIRVDVTNLHPASRYIFTFALLSSTNGSESKAVGTDPTLISTHSLGPAITLFFASDPSPSDSAEDRGFSNGDQLTLVFDKATNKPPVGNKDEIDKTFKFSVPLGAAYSGKWVEKNQLVITIDDVGQSQPALGVLNVKVIGDLQSPDGSSDVSISTSPPLIGSWEADTEATPTYFVPLDGNGGRRDPNDFSAYSATALQDTPRRVPLDLVFPGNMPRQRGYGIDATLQYPNGVEGVGIALNGTFEYGMSQSVREKGSLTNAQLAQALSTLTVIPSTGFTGYTCVSVSLVDRTLTSAGVTLSTVFVTIRFDAPAGIDVPTLKVGDQDGDLLSNPVGTLKTYKTPLIIALCTIIGSLVLAGLALFLYRKYRGGRDARDFEGQSLTADEEPNINGEGPTRRFYYDAKV